jgi:hypothetical protein
LACHGPCVKLAHESPFASPFAGKVSVSAEYKYMACIQENEPTSQRLENRSTVVRSPEAVFLHFGFYFEMYRPHPATILIQESGNSQNKTPHFRPALGERRKICLLGSSNRRG